MHRMKTISKVSLVLLLLCVSACAPKMRLTPGEIPKGEIPPKELKVEAEHYVSQHIEQENFKKIKSGPGLKRITNMVDRLTVASGFPKKTFPVHLVDAGDVVNAAAFNGASIVVYQELLNRLKSDDELATVLGHEMGHIIAKHYADHKEEQKRAAAVGVGSSILGSVVSIGTSLAGYGGAAGLAGDVTEASTGAIGYGAFVGSFSRLQEYEADHLGLLIMAKAGYNPKVAPELWKRSEEIFGGSSSSVGAFFSTHPAESDRQQKLEEAMPHALALYEAGKAKKK